MPTSLSLILLRGLPGSGKTTWAVEQVRQSEGAIIRVNKDSLRQMLHDGVFSRENERVVEILESHLVQQALERYLSVIVDNTHGNRGHINHFRLVAFQVERVIGIPIEVTTRMFDTPIEECVRRDSLRTGSARVGETVIREMAARWFQTTYGASV